MYRSRGASHLESPATFLQRHWRQYLYGGMATPRLALLGSRLQPYAYDHLYDNVTSRWLKVFGYTTKLLRYENYPSVTLPILELLGCQDLLDVLNDADYRRRISLTPELAVLNYRLATFFERMPHKDYMLHIHNNVLGLGEMEEYRLLRRSHFPSNQLFSTKAQKAYLRASHAQLKRLENAIESPLKDSEGYRQVLAGSPPSEALILDLIALFGKTFILPETIASYTE